MKKIFSLLLVCVMMFSALPVAYAANSQDYTAGTAVVYTASNSTDYAITVPATLAPGASSTVTLSGSWASNQTVKVTADPFVTLTNSINANDQKTLAVTFASMEKAGDNSAAQTYQATVSVEEMPDDALFGTWDGKFNYYVELVEDDTTNLISFTLYDAELAETIECQAVDGMTWAEWLGSDYCNATNFEVFTGTDASSGEEVDYISHKNYNTAVYYGDYIYVSSTDLIIDGCAYNHGVQRPEW